MTVLDEARHIAPALAAAAPTDDARRRLGDATWKNMLDGGVLRALQPTRWGGGEASLLEFVDTSMAVSAASPSAGWVAGVIGVHPWQLALFSNEAQEEMWGEDPTRMHSSSYNPTGKAEKVSGGYRVSGRWSFSTGCDHCVGVNLGAIAGRLDVGGGVELPDFRSFLLYRDQYRIEDNWNVSGLKGTGSKDIVVDGTFVPEYRTQSHLAYGFGHPLPGWNENTGVLYRLPWSVVFNAALASSVLGACRGFVEAWIIESKDRRLTGGVRLADDAIAQRRLAEATWDIEAAVTRLRADVVELTEMISAGDTATMAQRGQYRWNMNRGCEIAGEAVVRLFHAASGRSIFLDHPLQKRFQDVQAGLGHAFLIPDPPAKSVGGTLMATSSPEFLM